MSHIIKELDKEHRTLMAQEVEIDQLRNRKMGCKLLNNSGTEVFNDILLDEIWSGDGKNLAKALEQGKYVCAFEPVSDNKGVSLKRVSSERCQDFFEDAFDKLYLRGFCRDAVENGYTQIVLKDDSVERIYSSRKLLKALRNDAELKDVIGLQDLKKRHFHVECR